MPVPPAAAEARVAPAVGLGETDCGAGSLVGPTAGEIEVDGSTGETLGKGMTPIGVPPGAGVRVGWLPGEAVSGGGSGVEVGLGEGRRVGDAVGDGVGDGVGEGVGAGLMVRLPAASRSVGLVTANATFHVPTGIAALCAVQVLVLPTRTRGRDRVRLPEVISAAIWTVWPFPTG